MITLGAIVEGDGETTALPILVRRLGELRGVQVQVRRPFRVPRGKLVKDDELRRAIEAVARQLEPGAPILILLDADDDCIATIGARMLATARAARHDRELSVVLANREFEAWFLAALESLRGKRRIRLDATWDGDPESVRDAKRALREQMEPPIYSPTVDQAALASAMDLELARARSRSFDKLCRDLDRLLAPQLP
jgi:hypothetical protein